MRAVIYKSFGAPEVLTLVRDHPLPPRKAGEVLVKVHSTSVNPVDYKVRRTDASAVATNGKVLLMRKRI